MVNGLPRVINILSVTSTALFLKHLPILSFTDSAPTLKHKRAVAEFDFGLVINFPVPTDGLLACVLTHTGSRKEHCFFYC
jgi:hypothetical protein